MDCERFEKQLQEVRLIRLSEGQSREPRLIELTHSIECRIVPKNLVVQDELHPHFQPADTNSAPERCDLFETPVPVLRTWNERKEIRMGLAYGQSAVLDQDVHAPGKATSPAIQRPQNIMIHSRIGSSFAKSLYLPLCSPKTGKHDLVQHQQGKIIGDRNDVLYVQTLHRFPSP